MHRFDSEVALESHVLGRSLLSMLRNDDVGLETFPVQVPLVERTNPFDALRERLAVAAAAIRGLHAQVQLQLPPTLFMTSHINGIVNSTWDSEFLSSPLRHPLHA